MRFSEDQTEWRLTQERCESCQRRHLPEHLSCAALGKQQVAFVRHVPHSSGDGKFYGMEVDIPGFDSLGRCEVWCPLLCDRGPLGAPSARTAGAERLITQAPEWNEEVKSLVLDFEHPLSAVQAFGISMTTLVWQ